MSNFTSSRKRKGKRRTGTFVFHSFNDYDVLQLKEYAIIAILVNPTFPFACLWK